MDKRLKTLAEAAAGADPIYDEMDSLLKEDYDEFAKPPPVPYAKSSPIPAMKPSKEIQPQGVKGMELEKEGKFLESVQNELTTMIAHDKESQLRGTKQKGIEYANTCAIYSMIVLQRYLGVKFDLRMAMRDFSADGVKLRTVNNILVKTGLPWIKHKYPDNNPIPKNFVTEILNKAAGNLDCGMVLTQTKEHGENQMHLVVFYPVLMSEDYAALRIIDCSGEVSNSLLDPDVNVVEILFTSAMPAIIPKQLRGGGRRKTKKKQSSSKKTHGRRV